MNLFIIGNGFDQAHGLPTSYEDFHCYLMTKYPNANGNQITIPECSQGNHGEEIYDEDEIVSLLLYLISNAEGYGSKWKDFENSLGKFDYEELFDLVPVLKDKEGDEDYFKNAYNCENAGSELKPCVKQIVELFSDWISTIDESVHMKNKFALLINSDDLFLTFNYTNTLELVYGVKNICHIHGKKGEDLIVGHCDIEKDIEVGGMRFGSEESIDEMHEFLRKDTKTAIQNNRIFFDDLSQSISKIYSHGFSFSQVDEIYIKEICSRITTDKVTWYLDDYDKMECDKYKKTILRCGFKGSIELMSII